MFRLHWRGPSRIAKDTKHAKAGRLQWVLPKVAKSLGSLYTSPRWLLWRWRWKLGLEVSIHVITSKFLEILGSTTYVNRLWTAAVLSQKITWLWKRKLMKKLEPSHRYKSVHPRRHLIQNVPVVEWQTAPVHPVLLKTTTMYKVRPQRTPQQPATSWWALLCCLPNIVLHIYKGNPQGKVSEATHTKTAPFYLAISYCILWILSHCCWCRLIIIITTM